MAVLVCKNVYFQYLYLQRKSWNFKSTMTQTAMKETKKKKMQPLYYFFYFFFSDCITSKINYEESVSRLLLGPWVMKRDGLQHAVVRKATPDLGWEASYQPSSMEEMDGKATPMTFPSLQSPWTDPSHHSETPSSAAVTHPGRCQVSSVDCRGGQSIRALFSSLQPSTLQADDSSRCVFVGKQQP